MSYYRPEDNIEVKPLPGGRVQLSREQRGQLFTWIVEPGGFLTVIEAAAVVGASRVTVFTWVQNAKISAVSVKGTLMIRLADLRRFAKKWGYTIG